MTDHNKLRDELSANHGDDKARPILRSMYPSESRSVMAKEFARSFQDGFDAGYKARDEEVTKLREALEFYADKENWDTENHSPTCWDDGDIDLGNRAREALKGEK